MLKRSILGTAGAALAGLLTACGHTATPAAAHVGTGAARVSAACRQQFNTWSDGQGKGVLFALDAVSSAEAGADPRVLTATLEKNRAAISWAVQHPVPACVDPGRYWNALMMHVNAAANTNDASGAQAAMKGVPEIAQHLTAELKAL